LFEDPYVLVCGPSHPLARSRSVSPEKLAAYDFVLPSQGLPRRAVLDRMLERWGIKPKARIETSCLATILALLQCSNRISLLSRWHVDSLGSKDLRCIHVRRARFGSRFVGLATRSQWLPTPFQTDFLQLIRRSSRISSQPMRA
jgi:DNA-binding transcriptional LysR family regulator